MRLSKIAFTKLKKEIQQYQQEKFPELSRSVVNHGKDMKAIITEKEYRLKFRAGRQTEKEKVLAILETCHKQAMSKKSFFRIAKKKELKPYERLGKVMGIVYGKYKFRFKRLGFTEEKLDELDATLERKKELSISRGSIKEKRLHR